jgi:hypothetical protein
MENPIISPRGFLKKAEEVIEMGYYSTLTRCDPVKVVGMTEEQFRKKWKEKIELLDDDHEGYLDFYNWLSGKKEPDCLWFELNCEEWYAKHYADRKLAEFISQVIAEGTYCVLEFQGEDGAWWGYYITNGSVKEIKYVRMVDGKLIETN